MLPGADDQFGPLDGRNGSRIGNRLERRDAGGVGSKETGTSIANLGERGARLFGHELQQHPLDRTTGRSADIGAPDGTKQSMAKLHEMRSAVDGQNDSETPLGCQQADNRVAQRLERQ